MAWRIPLSDIDFDEQETGAVVGILKSKWLTMGEVTQEFESAFARYLSTGYAFAVSNGTAALHIAFRALGIGDGDEVICPALTFVATANAILYTGAIPVFADITSLDNFNISISDVRRKITPKTKAIAIVHYGGYPCEMDAIMQIARENNLSVIEDAAHAPGAEIMGKRCGTIGDVGCFSFFSNKNMVTGEGGMIVTNNRDLADKANLLRSHGMTTLTLDRHKGHAYNYDVVEMGYNYRIDEVKSVIGLVQLEKLDYNNNRRKLIVDEYTQQLRDVAGLRLPFQSFIGRSCYHLFCILLEEGNREDFMKNLREQGVQTSIHYPPIHLFKYYKDRFGYTEGMLPLSEEVGKKEVTLPLYPMMKTEDVKYVSDKVKESLPCLI